MQQSKQQFIPVQFVKKGWRFFKQNWQDIYKIIGIASILQLLASYFAGYNLTNLPELIQMMVNIALQAFSLVLSMNSIKLLLRVVRGRDYELSELFSLDLKLFVYVWTMIKVGVIVLAGLVLLIVPGVIWALKYSMVQFLIIDQEMESTEAMKVSAQMTEGVRSKLLWFALLLAGVNILGLLALGLGLLITIPVTYAANLLVYLHLLSAVEQGNSNSQVKQDSTPKIEAAEK